MSNNPYDAIVIGCGLAGANLAWQLHWKNKKLLIIDDQSCPSASRSAAGVISPITGKRHTTTPGWQESRREAHHFYRKIETATGVPLLRTMPQLRFPLSPISVQIRERIVPFGEIRDTSGDNLPLNIRPETARHGVMEIENDVLDVKLFLEATYAMLRTYHELHETLVAYADINIEDNGVSIPSLKATGRQIIFCEGAQGEANPWFADVPFESVRGESLIVDIEQLSKDRIYHHGISLVPTPYNQFYAGATYDWQQIDSSTTGAGRRALEESVTKMINTSFKTIEHRSGIRPVIRSRRPAVLQHNRFRHCWFFNGLASSGCLRAPALSKQLGQAILTGSFDSSLDNTRAKFSSENTDVNPRLTTRAHQLVGELLRPGDIAVDATAGNGNDTKFLAERVGPDGRVFALDIQPLALARSKKRLAELSFVNVEFRLENHRHLNTVIPEEFHEKLAVVMFNLGYLPGADEDLITLPSTTCSAIESAIALIKPGGACSILCYRGHRGGHEETTQVEALIAALQAPQFKVEVFRASSDERSPVLYYLKKIII